MPRNALAITMALAKHVPGGEKITGLRQISDGYSNETYLVEGLDLILRMPPTGNSLLAPFGVHDVVAQFRILEEWSSRPCAPPVPKAVHLESDPAALGVPFFLMERVAFDPWGDWAAPDWFLQGEYAMRANVSDQFVQTYAQLHRMQPLAALGPSLSISEELARWIDPVRQIDNPNLHAAIALLMQTAPAGAAPAPCHGDAKPANVLWRNGRIVAMVDYEMSFNGDPRFDLGSLLQAFCNVERAATCAAEIEGMWGRDRVIAEWEARTGRSAKDIVWFEAVSKMRYAAILAFGDWLAARDQASDPRYAALGSTLQRLSQSALELARSHAAGASAPAEFQAIG